MAVKKEDFTHRFSTLCETYNLSQKDVCDRTGISKGLISRYTNGKVCPNVTTIGIIANSFGINPAWLCGYDVPMVELVDENKNLKKLQKRVADLTEDQREKILNIIDTLYPKR